jgi:hypothetical protein
MVRLVQVQAPPPSLGDNTGDIDRLKRALAPALAGRRPLLPCRCLGTVAQAFRQGGFRGLAVLNDLPDCL